MRYKPVILLPLLILGCNNSPTESDRVEVPIPTQTGEEIYMMYCASCHGAQGDGNGMIQLDRPARSFVDGGFSFGNTVYAISKTTASGIPGTPMPPFADILTQQQINRVATHVRSFSPTIEDASLDQTEMVVVDKPLVARGMIPAINSELQLHPRGIVIGNPDRFSYEYRVDDVRLLSVRQGRFIQRVDWGERGGSPLELLGRMVVLVEEGNPVGMFSTQSGSTLRAQLRATNTMQEYGIIKYDLITQKGDIVASISETCVPTTGTRTLIEQRLIIDAKEPILIQPPPSTDVSNAPLIPVGEHEFVITHAIYEGNTK